MKSRDRVGAAATAPTREELARQYGVVWDTAELAKEFVVTAMIDTTLVVRRKADGSVGTMLYQNRPRYYFAFTPRECK